MRVHLINGDDFGASSVEIKGEWVIAKATGTRKGNTRVVPRENVEQIIVMDDEKWDQMSVTGVPDEFEE
jgi:hypothetical protein